MKPFRTPRCLENMGGCKGHYAFREEEEDLEGGPSPLHLPDEGQEGDGLVLEGLDAHLPQGRQKGGQLP